MKKISKNKVKNFQRRIRLAIIMNQKMKVLKIKKKIIKELKKKNKI